MVDRISRRPDLPFVRSGAAAKQSVAGQLTSGIRQTLLAGVGRTADRNYYARHQFLVLEVRVTVTPDPNGDVDVRRHSFVRLPGLDRKLNVRM